MLGPLADVIRDEANVKEIVFADDPAPFGAEVLVVNPRVVGKRLGPAMKDILAASKAGKWSRLRGGAVEVSGNRIESDEYEVRFQPKEGLAAAPFDGNAGVVVLDTNVTPELEREGLARDFIRMVQVARKDAGLNVADRIAIEVKAGPAAAAAIDAHLDDGQARDPWRLVGALHDARRHGLRVQTRRRADRHRHPRRGVTSGCDA